MRLTCVAPAEDEGLHVRQVLRQRGQVSYTALQKAKWHGQLLLNGQPCHTDAPVHAGDVLTLAYEEGEPVFLPRPYDLPLSIVWEDAHLLVVDKPAPLAVQCSARQPDDTLENALFSHLGCPESFVFRPVNRLDRGTSGLMLIARDPHSQQLMQRQLHTPALERVYLAVTDGAPPEEAGVIDLPIAKEDAASVRRIISPNGRAAVTHYRVLRHAGAHALVQLRLDTGRTHQIRVHLAAIGAPVTGDFLYGTETALLPGRFALHSAGLRFYHPIEKTWVTLTSPLPKQLAQALWRQSPLSSVTGHQLS